MYKVFIENSPLKFENNTSKNVNLVANFMPILKKDKYHEFAAQLSGLKEEVILNMADFNSFFNDFSYIEAAGGDSLS